LEYRLGKTPCDQDSLINKNPQDFVNHCGKLGIKRLILSAGIFSSTQLCQKKIILTFLPDPMVHILAQIPLVYFL